MVRHGLEEIGGSQSVPFPFVVPTGQIGSEGGGNRLVQPLESGFKMVLPKLRQRFKLVSKTNG